MTSCLCQAITKSDYSKPLTDCSHPTVAGCREDQDAFWDTASWTDLQIALWPWSTPPDALLGHTNRQLTEARHKIKAQNQTDLLHNLILRDWEIVLAKTKRLIGPRNYRAIDSYERFRNCVTVIDCVLVMCHIRSSVSKTDLHEFVCMFWHYIIHTLHYYIFACEIQEFY